MNNSWRKIGNARGQVQYFLESAFRIGFLIIALFIFFLLISIYLSSKINTQDLTYYVVTNRILYSDTIMYDENGRFYAGIVDLQKFNDATINANINYPNKRYAAARFTIINKTNGAVVSTAYLNKDQYDNLRVVVNSGLSGAGSAREFIGKFPITYTDSRDTSDGYAYGTLEIRMMVPNS